MKEDTYTKPLAKNQVRGIFRIRDIRRNVLPKLIAGFQCHAIPKRIKTIRQIKSRIWEMKVGKYTKTLAKIWVEGVIRIRDIRGNVLPKFIELSMETPCWSLSG